jgi:phenylacetate-coenzyme A ligase PaaK-like adenylate-forming protein
MTARSAALETYPLDVWAAQRVGAAAETLTREAITRYHLRALQQTVALARRKSSFYATRMAGVPAAWPRSLDEFAGAPLTSPADIVERGHEFLCVPQSEISRVVTLESSGTSGGRKRIFFTSEDQELALDFFAHGVASMGAAGDRMLIALPGEREGSVGYQLARGIARAGIAPISHGFILDPVEALEWMDREKVSLLIGFPVQMLALALQRGELARRVFHRLRTIILCSDHVAESLAHRIRKATGSAIFEHYGSTEMGLGGGVDCHAHSGYHLREADLYFEIVSPNTGEPLSEGETGEVVFTTLGRAGMPLIRYRTGDLSRIVPGSCLCGSPLRRMARVENRIAADIPLGSQGSVSIATLDDSLFAIPAVFDFAAALLPGTPNELQVRVYAPGPREHVSAEVKSALMRLPAIAANCALGDLQVTVLLQPEPFPVTGAKRTIAVHSIP